MKKNPSEQAATNATAPEHASAGQGAQSILRMRSKLSFERLVEMGAKMGMENPLFLCHDGAAKATTHIDGKEYINFSTYDYLDLNTHPEITAAVNEAALRYGTSAGASRLVGGERPPHRILERAIADFYEVEDAIAYVSGHATNVSTLGFLFGTRDAIFYDGLAHNSLMQGARLSGAERYSYTHNDCDALEKMLREHRAQHRRAVIVTEGLFSMDGNIPDLPRLIRLKKEFDCMLMVDEAHSLGVLGATGRGVREYFGVNPDDVDMWMSTLSKTLCGCGGFIAGRHELVEFLKYGSPGFVFSVGMPPIVAAACAKALELLQREPERVHRIQRISQFFLQYAWWATPWSRAFWPTPSSGAASTSCPSPSPRSRKARPACASSFRHPIPRTSSGARWMPWPKNSPAPRKPWTTIAANIRIWNNPEGVVLLHDAGA